MKTLFTWSLFTICILFIGCQKKALINKLESIDISESELGIVALP